MHDPYKEANRTMRYTDLGLSKQAEIIQPTNGSAAARTLYTDPANIVYYTTAQDLGNSVGFQIGYLIFTIHYTFSG